MSVTFSIDPHSAGTPFPHYWEQCVGSCHAVMGLRADWREQLEKCHRELGLPWPPTLHAFQIKLYSVRVEPKVRHPA